MEALPGKDRRRAFLRAIKAAAQVNPKIRRLLSTHIGASRCLLSGPKRIARLNDRSAT
jgi:hypothetical protein